MYRVGIADTPVTQGDPVVSTDFTTGSSVRVELIAEGWVNIMTKVGL